MTTNLSLPHLQRRLRQLSLCNSSQSALFYSQLYYAIFPPSSSSSPCDSSSHDGLHTYALALLANNDPFPALALVRDTADADAGESDDEDTELDGEGSVKFKGCQGCAVILARCANKVGRYSEGCAVLERALQQTTPGYQAINLPQLSIKEDTDLLMASLAQQAKNTELAAEHYHRALKIDPWCWEAFLGLCKLGIPPPAHELFPPPPPPAPPAALPLPPPAPPARPSPLPRSSASDITALRKQFSPLVEPVAGFFTPAPTHETMVPSRLGMLGQSWENTPSFQSDTTFPSLTDTPAPAIVPTRRQPLFNPSRTNVMEESQGRPSNKRQRAEKVLAPTAGGGINGKEADMLAPMHSKTTMDSGVVRRSSRLSQVGGGVASSRTGQPRVNGTRDKRSARSTRSRSATSSTGSTATRLPTTDSMHLASPDAIERLSQQATDDWLLDLVRTCARTWRSLCLYRCTEALAEIESLPREVRSCGWALAAAARAWYELADYTKARRAFEDVQRVEPYRLDSMEHYSTLLWHLNDAPALSYLSQRLLPIDREAPQPWIAAGNCFSLNADHDEAMRCFRRAASLKPECAYAWTLCGYEAVAMEEYDRATALYRTAIRADPRHYNAWYGLGLVYMNTGKLRHALHHFDCALEINPTNAVLLCCVGAVYEKQAEYEMALSVYDRACEFAPDSAMVRFKSIRVRVCLGQYEIAAQQLEVLKRKTENEPNIYLLLGKVLHKLGRREKAIQAFVVARELDTKLEGPIRVILEGVEDGDESLA